MVSWNILLVGYVESAQDEDVLRCLQKNTTRRDFNMCKSMYLLDCCRSIGAIDRGFELHTNIIKRGIELDLSLGTSLLEMYAKLVCFCEEQNLVQYHLYRGFFVEAPNVCNELPYPNAFVWCALTAGFTKYGSSEEILVRIDEMLTNYKLFSVAIAICRLQACGSISTIDLGLELHPVIVKRGLEGDSSVGFALFSMYGKCCSFIDSFNNEQCSDVSWWKDLINCYSQHHYHENVLKCMEKMKLEGIPVNNVGCICGLKAYTSSKSIDKGLKLHSKIVKAQLENQHFVSKTLLSGYVW